ncbi:MAG: TonB family protein [Gemmatimonadaceae bacterium]
MIATIMLSTLLASLAFVLAAHCAERGLRAVRRPTRVPWIIATAASAAIPFAQLLALSLSSPAPASGRDVAQSLPLTTILTTVVTERFNASIVGHLESWLIGLWLCASVVMSVRLFLSTRALNRLAGSWRRSDIAGVRVWISQGYGPAVIGVHDPEIVIPRRIAELPLDDQRLALAHELEHIGALDHWIVRGAAVAAAAVPWNPLVWLAARRLRSAIEIDCDMRVLSKKPNVNAYASLVLKVASWPRESPAGALALGEPAVAQLERRLRLMTAERRSPHLASATVLVTGALALAAFGCDVAVNVERPDVSQVHVLDTVITTAVTTPSRKADAYFEFQVDRPVTAAPGSAWPRYPNALRLAGVEGEVLAQFVVDENGRPDVATFKALKSSHDLFAQAIRAALPAMQFVPAQVRGNNVKQLVQQPFAFTIAR